MARPRMVNTSGEDTREQILTAATDLLRDYFADESDPANKAVGFLSPSRVAERSGRAKTMIYHYWQNIDDLLQECVASLWSERFDIAMSELAEMNDITSLPDYIEAWTSWMIRLNTGGPMQAPWRASLALTSSGMEWARPPQIWDRVAEHFEMQLNRRGRVLKPGIDAMSVAVALMSLVEGFSLRHLDRSPGLDTVVSWHSDLDEPGAPPRQWTSMEIAVESLYLNMTDPKEA